MEISRILAGLLFLVVGLALFAGAIYSRLQMEQEVRGGRKIAWNNVLPYGKAENFSARGNRYRKTYNLLYLLLILYAFALLSFVNSAS
ncbi:MAG: hypothetical protein GY815_10265 [Gammaproteobacteria bacterium]|nr:hypothetical protein [Gammaproteobacteria bacterium]